MPRVTVPPTVLYPNHTIFDTPLVDLHDTNLPITSDQSGSRLRGRDGWWFQDLIPFDLCVHLADKIILFSNPPETVQNEVLQFSVSL